MRLTPEQAALARLGNNSCPLCSASWRLLERMLADKSNWEDWMTAYLIVQNCPCCKAQFPGLEPGAIVVTLPKRR